MSKLNRKQKIGLGIAALLGLCCCGGGISSAFDDDTKPVSAPNSSTPPAIGRLIDGDTTPTPAVGETSADATTAPPVPTPTPTRTVKPATKPAPTKTTAPKPKTTTVKPKPKPTTAKPSTPSVRQGVHPGAFCAPEGARGVTSKGTPMRCTRKAGEERARWRAA
ncbi:hypothetical protein ACGFH8_31005 [Micromonospora sp. NPDC049175]|uniref:hypothetical protein n=1 Tax=Micromonospora sp. NPDC049175 TaxID=3364266 RepID=UPI0037244953